jgi:hypothetical protein
MHSWKTIGGIVVVALVIAAISWFFNRHQSDGTSQTKRGPNFKMIRSNPQEGTTLVWTLRNVGGAGGVLVTVHQGNRIWKFGTHFDAGEERIVRLPVPELGPGNYEIKTLGNPTQAELQGANAVN